MNKHASRTYRPESHTFFTLPTGVSSLHHTQRLWRLLRNSHAPTGRFFGSIVLTTLVSFCNLFLYSLLFPLAQGLINHDFSSVRSVSGLGELIMFFPNTFQSQTSLFLALVGFTYAVTIIKNAISYSAELLILRQAVIISRTIRQDVFERYLLFGKAFFDQHNMSDLNEKLMLSSRIISSQFTSFQALLSQILSLLVFLGCMIWISWPLTLVVLIVFPIISLANSSIKRRLKRISAEATRATTDLTKRIGNILAGISIVKGYGKEDFEKGRFLAVSNEEIEKTYLMEKQRKLLNPINDLSSTTGMLLVALAVASLSLFSGSIAPAHLFVFLYLALKAVPALNAVNSFGVTIASDSGLIDSLEEIFQNNAEAIIPEGSRRFAGLFDRIEFKDLHFTYVGRSSALKGVSFTLEKGSMTALVGESGSGKTTIFNLLLRFYDCPPGSIWIDGVDIREFSSASLREHISFVSQDMPIFDDTIRANICYALENVPDTVLIEACRKARIYEFISKLPQGFDTQVGDRGTQLSGGERQRLAIARAFLKKADIILLDEITSSLDAETATAISAAIHELTAGKTVLIIAHNLFTIERANNVVVLHHGKVIDQGSPAGIVRDGHEFSRTPGKNHIPDQRTK